MALKAEEPWVFVAEFSKDCKYDYDYFNCDHEHDYDKDYDHDSNCG